MTFRYALWRRSTRVSVRPTVHPFFGFALRGLFSLFLTLSAGRVLAEDILDVGMDGVAGSDGAPGLPGEAGGDGESAGATANAAGLDNTATAQGGSGGDATPSSGTDGGRGGNSGSGGDAFAQATTIGRSLVRATATAGGLDTVGAGGTGSAPGVDGESGGLSGVSGAATVIAHIERDFLPAVSAGLSGFATAKSNNGGAI